MPLSPEHKNKSRIKILNSAVKRFTHQGFNDTSIDQVMQDAKLTRGAFYNHFSSKSDLYQKAISHAAINSNLAKQKPADMSDKVWLDVLLTNYLSKGHIKSKGQVCPLAFLATDIASREPKIKSTYTHAFQNMSNLIANYADKTTKRDEEEVLAITAMIIGSVAVARALNNQTTIDKLLKSTKAIASEMLGCNKTK